MSSLNEFRSRELLAHGFRHGTGQREDEAHHLQRQEQGEGQVHGVEVVARRDRGQPRRQEAPALQLDAREAEQEDHDQPAGQAALRGLPFDQGVQGVEEVGSYFKKAHAYSRGSILDLSPIVSPIWRKM